MLRLKGEKLFSIEDAKKEDVRLESEKHFPLRYHTVSRQLCGLVLTFNLLSPHLHILNMNGHIKSL